jgi:biopolymer transport protein ExbB
VPAGARDALRSLFRSGDYRGAYAYCESQAPLIARVVGAGLRHAPDGKGPAEDAMVSAIMAGNARFQNKIAYLSVIGVIAPMIGLAGTVFGMIEAFAAMGQAGAADPSKLSGAIGKVLYATAGGLVVAIPAFVFYYLLRNRTAHAIHLVQEAANDLFRRFPYDDLAGSPFEGAEPCAARPAWIVAAESTPSPPPAGEGVPTGG